MHETQKNKRGVPEPTGDNLNIDGVIFVNADGTGYGFKIVNTTMVPLYVSMFCFDVTDLEVRT